MTSRLELRAVAIRLGDRVLVPRLDAVVEPGEVLSVMGPSGSGKSTLLAYLAGFLEPAFRAEGAVLVGGEVVTRLPPERRRMGLLFQDDLLFPHLTVAGNLAFGLRPEVKGAARRDAVEQALADAGLAGFGPRNPATLSGGQKARVALLRTLLAEPRALLLDEPFGKLDQDLRQEIRRFVFDHAAARRLPTLLVTHDPQDAAAAGGRVITLGHQGIGGLPLTPR